MAEELTISRLIDAPPELVWEAWIDPEYTKRWWGPKGLASSKCSAMQTFEEQDGKTELTIRHYGMKGISAEDVENIRRSWDQALDELEGLVTIRKEEAA
jgi:uncharacterized protein YndB with AHSA1/START domain